MSKEPTQATWDNLKKVAGDHADHVKMVYNAQNWNMLIGDYADRYEGLVWRDNRIRELETRLAEAPETSVVEQLQAKDEEIKQLKSTLDDQVVEINKMEVERLRLSKENEKLWEENYTRELEAEKFDWNKFLVGLSKDQTFQRGLRHTVTFAIGVLASQFPEYAPYILGLAGVWGLGTEVQAYQVNQKQIVKEKK